MWTVQDIDLVETLARRVGMLSAEQIALIPWGLSSSGTHKAEPRLRKLIASDLVANTIVNARRLARSEPVYQWNPGQDDPDFEQIVEIITSRWPRAAEPVQVYWATKRTANLFGSSAGQLPKLDHRDHDLLLADAYVSYRLRRPTEAVRWCGENAVPKAGYRIKDPDAFLVAPSGRILRVIESAGCYGLKQICEFHDHCASEQLPYELW
jgi:hypothetical protein